MSAVIVLIIRIALAGVLYLFLGWALWVLWRDLRASGGLKPTRRVPVEPIELREMDSGQLYSFVKSQVSLGRDPASELYIQNEAISARHALLSYHHGQWWVQDLGSKNGTFLNQHPVEEPLALADGDELQFGELVYEVKLSRRVDEGADPVYNHGDPQN